jgi:hypothetical protein
MEPTAPALSFREEDFSLFQEDRRANNRFNKDRLALKEKLTHLGMLLAKAVPESWTMELGTEHPAVWNQRQVDRFEVFFMRPEAERKTLSRALNREIPMSVLLQAPSPLYAHASLGFFLDERGIEVGFRLPFLAIGDRSQLRRLIAEPGWPEALAAFSPVLSGFEFSLFSPGPGASLDATSPAHWLESLADLERVGQGGDHRAYLGLVTRITVAESIAAEDVEALLLPALKSLAPFALAQSWRPESDRLDVAGMIAAQASASQVERERSEQLRQELIQPRPVVARPIMTSARTEPARAQDRTPHPAAPAAGAPLQPLQRPLQSQQRPVQSQQRPVQNQPHPAKPQDRPVQNQPRPAKPQDRPAQNQPRPAKPQDRPAAPPRPREKKPISEVEPGDRIVLASGPFQGKEAIVVAELPDDQLRIRVGMMQMTVERKDCLAGRG